MRTHIYIYIYTYIYTTTNTRTYFLFVDVFCKEILEEPKKRKRNSVGKRNKAKKPTPNSHTPHQSLPKKKKKQKTEQQHRYKIT